MEIVWRDLKYGIGTLTKSPGRASAGISSIIRMLSKPVLQTPWKKAISVQLPDPPPVLLLRNAAGGRLAKMGVVAQIA